MEVKTKKPILKKWWFWVIIVIVAIGIIGNNENKTDSGKEADSKVREQSNENVQEKTELEKALEGAIEIDYKKLHSDFMDNAIKADSDYKGKMIILTGEVYSIDREIGGEPYITFEVDGMLNSIRITFKKSEESKVAEFSKGQTVKIVGKCTGTLLSTTVALKEAMLIK